MNDKHLLSDCFQYLEALREAGSTRDVPELLTKTSYVYLSRWQRIWLAARILGTLFW